MPARSDLSKHLEKETLQPVYALISKEVALRSEGVEALRAAVLTVAPDFNRDEFRAGDASVEQVLQAAATMPMMAPHRWVHLSDIHTLDAAALEPVLAYLADPMPTTVLCLSGTSLKLTTKLGKRLAAAKSFFQFEPPKQRGLGTWIEKRAASRGWRITPQAAHLLGDLVGPEVGMLDVALDTLWIHAGGQSEIAEADVEAVVAPTRVHSIFEFTDAVGARDAARASRLLRNALEGGSVALQLLAMIARQFRLLLQVKSLRDQGARGGELAKRAGVAPFLVDSLSQQAARYSEAELCGALAAAARADVRLKSTRLPAGVVLDRLLVEVMQKP